MNPSDLWNRHDEPIMVERLADSGLWMFDTGIMSMVEAISYCEKNSDIKHLRIVRVSRYLPYYDADTPVVHSILKVYRKRSK